VFRVAFPSLFSVKAGGPSKPLLERQTPPFYIFLLSNMPPPKTGFLALVLSLFLSFSLCLSFRVPCRFPFALFCQGWGAIQTSSGETNPPFLHLSSFQYAATQNRVFSTLSLSFLSFSLCLSFRVPCRFPFALFCQGWGAIQTFSGETNPPFLHLSSFQYATTQNRVFSTLSLAFSLFLSLFVVPCSVSLSLRSFLSRLGGHPNLLEREPPPFFTSFFFPICHHPKPCFLLFFFFSRCTFSH